MKSDIQTRAEDIFERSHQHLRKPIVVEFSGSPKAGKTTVISQTQAFLKRIGFRTEVVVERASVCPIRDKRHFNFNIWTACTTLSQLLEKTQDPPRLDDPEVLILDRGIFDAICWLRMMENLARLQASEREVIERFLMLGDWRKRIAGVIVMTASPSHSMERERGHLPVLDSNGNVVGGSIMNNDVLTRFSSTVEDVAKAYDKDFLIEIVNTSAPALANNVPATCEAVTSKILDWIDTHVLEKVLTLPREVVTQAFPPRTSWIARTEASKLAAAFLEKGQFVPRDHAESSDKMIQALPVAVIRNATGNVLRLRRKERDKSNYLHEKLVIWAGGHVREEDRKNGDPLLATVVRELNEELRLRISKEELTLVGAIFHKDYGDRTAKHVAIVYEWTAKTDDISVVLSTAEFFERTGASLSGKFVSVDSVDDSGSPSQMEPWSHEIVANHLSVHGVRQNGLF